MGTVVASGTENRDCGSRGGGRTVVARRTVSAVSDLAGSRLAPELALRTLCGSRGRPLTVKPCRTGVAIGSIGSRRGVPSQAVVARLTLSRYPSIHTKEARRTALTLTRGAQVSAARVVGPCRADQAVASACWAVEIGCAGRGGSGGCIVALLSCGTLGASGLSDGVCITAICTLELSGEASPCRATIPLRTVSRLTSAS